jgi:hypothetical protein
MARQPLRSLRVPDHIWEGAMKTAKSRGESLNAVANRLLAAYGGVDAVAQPWITQPDQVLVFGRILVHAEVFDTAAAAFHYLEKPYKWDDLHDEWERLGCPQPPSLDDLEETRMLGAGTRDGELRRKHSRDEQRWTAFTDVVEAQE